MTTGSLTTSKYCARPTNNGVSCARRVLKYLLERGGGVRYYAGVDSASSITVLYVGTSARDAVEAYNNAYYSAAE